MKPTYLANLITKYISYFMQDDQPHFVYRPVNSGVAAAALPGIETDDESKSTHIVLHGNLHYEMDIQGCLSRLRFSVRSDARLIVVYYNQLWKPLLRIADAIGLRRRHPENNWLDDTDVRNLLYLAGFEIVLTWHKVLVPIRVPVLSNWINRWIAPLPLLRSLTLARLVIARPAPSVQARDAAPSVSVVVPARNEAGNIEELVRRLPRMGPDDELIFVEGNSDDNTWEVIQAAYRNPDHRVKIRIFQQDGRGKGDAVRKGFEVARNEVLMILDADMTVRPEDLANFYSAFVEGRGEFLNGSRLVYPMTGKAMRFLNFLGNRFFAAGFHFVLGQPFKDTLCGTKVISRENWLRLVRQRKYFGDFDPFGDFDLIFGANRLALRTTEIPIRYQARIYGKTNISRWTHGLILLRMLWFSARRIRFI